MASIRVTLNAGLMKPRKGLPPITGEKKWEWARNTLVEFPEFLVAFFEKLWRVLVNSRFNNLRRIFLAEMKIPE